MPLSLSETPLGLWPNGTSSDRFLDLRAGISSLVGSSGERSPLTSSERSKSLLSDCPGFLWGSARSDSDSSKGAVPDGAGRCLSPEPDFSAFLISASRSISSVRKESSGPLTLAERRSRRTSLSLPVREGLPPRATSSLASPTILTSLSLAGLLPALRGPDLGPEPGPAFGPDPGPTLAPEPGPVTLLSLNRKLTPPPSATRRTSLSLPALGVGVRALLPVPLRRCWANR